MAWLNIGQCQAWNGMLDGTIYLVVLHIFVREASSKWLVLDQEQHPVVARIAGLSDPCIARVCTLPADMPPSELSLLSTLLKLRLPLQLCYMRSVWR